MYKFLIYSGKFIEEESGVVFDLHAVAAKVNQKFCYMHGGVVESLETLIKSGGLISMG